MVFPFSLLFFFLFDENSRNHGDLAQRMSIQMKRCTPFCQNVLSFLILSRRLSKRRQKLLYRDENHTILRSEVEGNEKEG